MSRPSVSRPRWPLDRGASRWPLDSNRADFGKFPCILLSNLGPETRPRTTGNKRQKGQKTIPEAPRSNGHRGRDTDGRDIRKTYKNLVKSLKTCKNLLKPYFSLFV